MERESKRGRRKGERRGGRRKGKRRERKGGEKRGGRGAHLRVFCTSSPTITAMVVGREAAHTPHVSMSSHQYQMPPPVEGHTEEKGERERRNMEEGEEGEGTDIVLVCAYLHAVYMYNLELSIFHNYITTRFCTR